MSRICRFGALAAVVALGLTFFCLPASAASMSLVPAQDDVASFGPRFAKGAIVWSHGRSVDAEDSLTPTPGYILEMREAGWDTFRFDRLRRDDTLPGSGATLAAIADRLRAAGYHRVVLAGQSFGAFLSLIAATRSDAVDAVIATAPAAFGNAQENPDTYRLNATRLFQLLGEVRRARVALAFFSDDIFDPGGRAAIADDVLARRGLPRLVIDRPAGIASHWAAGSRAFARQFASCLEAFAEDDRARGALACAPPAETTIVHASPDAAG